MRRRVESMRLERWLISKRVISLVVLLLVLLLLQEPFAAPAKKALIIWAIPGTLSMKVKEEAVSDFEGLDYKVIVLANPSALDARHALEDTAYSAIVVIAHGERDKFGDVYKYYFNTGLSCNGNRCEVERGRIVCPCSKPQEEMVFYLDIKRPAVPAKYVILHSCYSLNPDSLARFPAERFVGKRGWTFGAAFFWWQWWSCCSEGPHTGDYGEPIDLSELQEQPLEEMDGVPRDMVFPSDKRIRERIKEGIVHLAMSVNALINPAYPEEEAVALAASAVISLYEAVDMGWTDGEYMADSLLILLNSKFRSLLPDGLKSQADWIAYVWDAEGGRPAITGLGPDRIRHGVPFFVYLSYLDLDADLHRVWFRFEENADPTMHGTMPEQCETVIYGNRTRITCSFSVDEWADERPEGTLFFGPFTLFCEKTIEYAFQMKIYDKEGNGDMEIIPCLCFGR